MKEVPVGRDTESKTYNGGSAREEDPRRKQPGGFEAVTWIPEVGTEFEVLRLEGRDARHCPRFLFLAAPSLPLPLYVRDCPWSVAWNSLLVVL